VGGDGQWESNWNWGSRKSLGSPNRNRPSPSIPREGGKRKSRLHYMGDKAKEKVLGGNNIEPWTSSLRDASSKKNFRLLPVLKGKGAEDRLREQGQKKGPKDKPESRVARAGRKTQAAAKTLLGREQRKTSSYEHNGLPLMPSSSWGGDGEGPIYPIPILVPAWTWGLKLRPANMFTPFGEKGI